MSRKAIGIRLVVFLALLAGLAVDGFAQDIPTKPAVEGVAKRFAAANHLYSQAKYEEAAKAYSELVDEGYSTLAVYLNLGNCYMQTDELGRAVLYYRRALLVAPRDADALHNLDYVGNRLDFHQSEAVESWTAAVLEWLMARVTLNEVAGFTLVIWWLTAVLGVARMRSGRRRVTLALCAAGVLLVASMLLTYTKWQRDYGSRASIVVSVADMRSGPGGSFESLARLEPGLEVRVLQTQGRYAEIRTYAGGRGWVVEDQIVSIVPPERGSAARQTLSP